MTLGRLKVTFPTSENSEKDTNVLVPRHTLIARGSGRVELIVI